MSKKVIISALVILIFLETIFVLYYFFLKNTGISLTPRSFPFLIGTKRVDHHSDAVTSAKSLYDINGSIKTIEQKGRVYYLTLSDKNGKVIAQDILVDPNSLSQVAILDTITGEPEDIEFNILKVGDQVQATLDLDLKKDILILRQIYKT